MDTPIRNKPQLLRSSCTYQVSYCYTMQDCLSQHVTRIQSRCSSTFVDTAQSDYDMKRSNHVFVSVSEEVTTLPYIDPLYEEYDYADSTPSLRL